MLLIIRSLLHLFWITYISHSSSTLWSIKRTRAGPRVAKMVIPGCLMSIFIWRDEYLMYLYTKLKIKTTKHICLVRPFPGSKQTAHLFLPGNPPSTNSSQRVCLQAAADLGWICYYIPWQHTLTGPPVYKVYRGVSCWSVRLLSLHNCCTVPRDSVPVTLPKALRLSSLQLIPSLPPSSRHDDSHIIERDRPV